VRSVAVAVDSPDDGDCAESGASSNLATAMVGQCCVNSRSSEGSEQCRSRSCAMFATEIRARRARGASVIELAREFDAALNTIRSKGRRWTSACS
jgi:hypothetical protein